MCIICVSPARTRQPSISQIKTMFRNNPHGAGYMFARDGRVQIHKGFMDVDSFLDAIREEHFTAKDSVVYHFRISTQAGVNPEMTHPFPLSNRLSYMKALDVECRCGIAHNGIIRLTSDRSQREYSDTALFITQYMARMLHSPEDLRNEQLLNRIEQLAGSKLAIMDTLHSNAAVWIVFQAIGDNRIGDLVTNLVRMSAGYLFTGTQHSNSPFLCTGG